MKFKYDKTIEEVIQLQITETNLATFKDFGEESEATVQLANDAEATQMIAEFEDPDGELMHKEGSIFGKYEELREFRP